MSMMTADQLLSHLGLAMNVPGLAFDANGCARLMVDGRIAVNFEADAANQAVQIYTTLGPLPGAGAQSVYRALLEGNLFGAQTLGATLAIDGLYNEIVLCRSVSLEGTDGPSFAGAVEKFVAAAEEWSNKVQSGELAGAQVGSAQDAAAPPMVTPDALEPRVHAHFLRV